MSIVENINLSPALLSLRSDLPNLDKPNPVTDRRLAKHLVSFYKQGATQSAHVDQLLADYISHARLHAADHVEAAKALVAGVRHADETAIMHATKANYGHASPA